MTLGPNESSYDFGVHLSINDIALDEERQPSIVRVTLKNNLKHTPFGRALISSLDGGGSLSSGGHVRLSAIPRLGCWPAVRILRRPRASG